MPHRVQESTRTSFVDFIYAVVVGSTFPFLAPFDASFRLVGLLFLILVVLEDFYLFHTQIAGKVSDAPTSFLALVLELLILVAWYLSVISFPSSPRPCLVAFAAFFLFKWLAGVAHFTTTHQLRSWRFQRCHVFFIPLFTSVIVAWRIGTGKLSQPSVWISVLLSWLACVAIWWYLTAKREHTNDVA